jgi:hypothetical protein
MKILLMTALLASGASAEQASVPGAAMRPASPAPRKVPPGYLAGKPPVDVIKLLPPPPKPGSRRRSCSNAATTRSPQHSWSLA